MYIFVVACDMSIDVPYYCPFILRACDLASGWSLAIGHHVILLVTCRVTCYTVLLYFLLFSFHGRLCKRLVACYWFQCRCTGRLHGCLCRVRAFLEKLIQLLQVTWASTWLLAFNSNGNQGGRLSSCRRELCTCTGI